MMEIILTPMLNTVLDKCFLMLKKEAPQSLKTGDLFSLPSSGGLIHALGTFDHFLSPVYS